MYLTLILTQRHGHGMYIHMKLSQWQKEQGLTDAQLAKLFSVDPSYIFRLKKGERRGSPDLAFLIERITDGKVSRTEVCWP